MPAKAQGVVLLQYKPDEEALRKMNWGKPSCDQLLPCTDSGGGEEICHCNGTPAKEVR